MKLRGQFALLVVFATAAPIALSAFFGLYWKGWRRPETPGSAGWTPGVEEELRGHWSDVGVGPLVLDSHGQVLAALGQSLDDDRALEGRSFYDLLAPQGGGAPRTGQRPPAEADGSNPDDTPGDTGGSGRTTAIGRPGSLWQIIPIDPASRRLSTLIEEPPAGAAFVAIPAPMLPRTLRDLVFRRVAISLVVALFTSAVALTLLLRRTVRSLRQLNEAAGQLARGGGRPAGERRESPARHVPPRARSPMSAQATAFAKENDGAKETNGDVQLSPRGNDEVADVMRSFIAMRASLREEEARRSRLLLGVTHDLRTPLTGIVGYLEAIRDGLAADPQQLSLYLNIMQEKAQLLDDRISELIGYVRMETGEWMLNLHAHDLREVLASSVQAFREDAAIRGAAFDAEIRLNRAFPIRCDDRFVHRVLENLVHNAFAHTPPDKLVLLTAQEESDEISIRVADWGAGIPESDRSEVFSPFYRGTRGRNERGFGLGLAVVRSIVESHGWTVTIDPPASFRWETQMAPASTVFRISIPRGVWATSAGTSPE